MIKKYLLFFLDLKNNFWPVKGNITFPIAHEKGRYYFESSLLKKLQDKNQIWIGYKNNPNGSLMDIAGITNEYSNVAGLMPHPERAVASLGWEEKTTRLCLNTWKSFLKIPIF